MTGRYVLSPRAQADLDNIWDYSAKRWGKEQAEAYTREIWQRIEKVAARPATGQECSDIRVGYYKISCGSHFLFYRIVGDGIDVVRILHERMDFERHIPRP
jgi:toxin ParE1/3/4